MTKSLRNSFTKMKAIVFLFGLASFATQAQESPLMYSDVIAVDSVSAGQLFERARRWFNSAFRDSDEVLNIQDRESSELSGKGRLKYSSRVFSGSVATEGYITFRITVLTKDGRYKYEVTDFTHEGNDQNRYGPADFGFITTDSECPYTMKQVWPRSASLSSGKAWTTKVWNDIKSVIDKDMTTLVASLIQEMNKPAGSESEW